MALAGVSLEVGPAPSLISAVATACGGSIFCSTRASDVKCKRFVLAEAEQNKISVSNHRLSSALLRGVGKRHLSLLDSYH